MAISVFGVTTATLAAEYFPHNTFDVNSEPATANITILIGRRGARISGLVEALGIAADGLDDVGEPMAFRNCARLVGVGAAIDVALAMLGRKPSDGIVQAWKDEWTEGLRILENPQRSKSFLRDALTAAAANHIQTHIQDSGDTPTASGDVEVLDPVFTADMEL